MKKLTAPQLRALRLIAEQHDHNVAVSLRHWGEDEAKSVASKPSVALVEVRTPTWQALWDAGAIEVRHERGEYATERRGAYGRRTGGSDLHPYTASFARPTDVGRAMLSQQKGK